jgi:zinc and cadmium transporter
MQLILTIIFSAIASLGPVLLAGLLLAFKEARLRKIVPWLLSYATGTLLAAVFLDLIPEALEKLPARDVSIFLLAGIIGFFILEKLVIWRHCCHDDEHHHGHNNHAGTLILVGDAVHNITDGIIIAASFYTSTALGIVVSLAIIAHELPQEVSDFIILLDSGYTKVRALVLNLLTSCTTVITSIVSFFYLDKTQAIVPYVVTVSAASFIYVAISDLIPSLHSKTKLLETLLQLILIFVGMLTIVVFHG